MIAVLKRILLLCSQQRSSLVSRSERHKNAGSSSSEIPMNCKQGPWLTTQKSGRGPGVSAIFSQSIEFRSFQGQKAFWFAYASYTCRYFTYRVKGSSDARSSCKSSFQGGCIPRSNHTVLLAAHSLRKYYTLFLAFNPSCHPHAQFSQ